MKYLDRIKMKSFEASSKEGLDDFLRSCDSPTRSLWKNEELVFYVEDAGRPRVIMHIGRSHNSYSSEMHFHKLKEHIANIQPLNFWDCAFALDSLLLFIQYPPHPLPPLQTEISYAIEPILALSRGYLVWNFQFEMLAKMFGLYSDESVQFRKYFNKKNSDYLYIRNEMEQMMFDDELSFIELTQKRLYGSHVVSLNPHGAQWLWKIISEEIIKDKQS